MLLAELVNVSRAVAGTRSRLEKRALLCDAMRRAGPAEVALAVHYLGGTLPQGRIGLGPAIVKALRGASAASTPELTLGRVNATFAEIAAMSGKGSQQARRDALGRLFGRATPAEQEFLARLITGEMRQGALEGLLVEALADAAEIDADALRRAVMLAADPATVAAVALREGVAGLSQFRLEPLSPVKPMLAQPADDMAAALDTLGRAALEYKLDGARVQIHRVGDEVRIFSRRQNDVTASLPEIVAAARALPLTSAILDGEVIALREDGRPLPFQVTMRRFGRKTDIEAMREKLPLSVFLFDCLHRDGDDLIDRPFSERADALADAADERLLVPRLTTADADAATRFLAAAFEAGHEGVMAKSLSAPYAAGSRGAEWLKVKQAHTLDLVILAAEWGSGRRRGWLSNLHLGARNPADGSFVMLGKTFKGLTDRMLRWQTERLLELEVGRDDHVVQVRPEVVAEIAVSDIQASPQYPAGMALRFARVKGYREDKTAAEADTIETVRALFAAATGA